jgi:hypothetical protein
MIKFPEHIICEDTLFTLGAIDEHDNGYYLSTNGGFIRADDLYVSDEILNENGIPQYDEYAINGLYFEFDCLDGSLSKYVRKMLSSPNCKVFTDEMRRFIEKECASNEN